MEKSVWTHDMKHLVMYESEEVQLKNRCLFWVFSLLTLERISKILCPVRVKRAVVSEAEIFYQETKDDTIHVMDFKGLLLRRFYIRVLGGRFVNYTVSGTLGENILIHDQCIYVPHQMISPVPQLIVYSRAGIHISDMDFKWSSPTATTLFFGIFNTKLFCGNLDGQTFTLELLNAKSKSIEKIFLVDDIVSNAQGVKYIGIVQGQVWIRIEYRISEDHWGLNRRIDVYNLDSESSGKQQQIKIDSISVTGHFPYNLDHAIAYNNRIIIQRKNCNEIDVLE